MDSSFPKFFDLPTEIRDLILSFLIPTAQDLPLESPASHPPLNLLLSHPLISQPVLHLFFSRNTFTANDPPTVLAVPVPTLHRIRRLTLSLDPLREAALSSVLPLVREAVLSGSLRSLRIVVGYQGLLWGPPRRASAMWFGRFAETRKIQAELSDAAVMPVALCREMVHLLADPYLETAELRAKDAHRAFWCGYHAGVECWLQRWAAATTKRSRLPGASRARMIEMDLRSLARDIGDEDMLRIVAVGR